MKENENYQRFGVYVHWPFCSSLCPYCDFNSHLQNKFSVQSWGESIIREIEYFGEKTKSRRVSSIFFGGGTPSLMDPEALKGILAKISRTWTLESETEITLEANPTSIEIGKFRDFKSLGVNRVSLGIQSLNDSALTFLGRNHSASEGIRAIKIASKTFSNFSFDLIYARPRQSVNKWKRELKEGLELGANHLSLYQLSIEPGTEFYRRKINVPDSDAAANYYKTTQEIMENRGMPAYEISNHSIPGSECKHNLLYWEGHDYVGLGPGAHSRLQFGGKIYAIYQIHDPKKWVNSVSKRGHGTAKNKIISLHARGEELIMLGLRTPKGIKISRLERQTNKQIGDFFNPIEFNNLIKNGFLQNSGGYIRATLSGRMCLNLVLRKLMV
tara:strand:- start:291 stop:1445 length:1155 start_codon:yes stop_codon:yes gene_type:complete